MTPSTTDMTSKQLTTMVIYWLNKNEYSKNHWNVVANEMMEKAENDKEMAEQFLAEALIAFHKIYKETVIQPDNLLFAMISDCFDLVDWLEVARSKLD
ncbi:hypothetical protein HOH45_02650 [bacterium]|jgi:hypothetical protein|nr:hypothetical protein [bacterium]